MLSQQDCVGTSRVDKCQVYVVSRDLRRIGDNSCESLAHGEVESSLRERKPAAVRRPYVSYTSDTFFLFFLNVTHGTEVFIGMQRFFVVN